MARFDVYYPVPRAVHEHADKEWLWEALEAVWANNLRNEDGMRLPGPLRMATVDYGYIDDNTMRRVYVNKPSREWTFATWRISGPATRRGKP